MSLFVKICGVTAPDAVEAAVEAGADAVGFNFYPPSPRFLSLQRAAALAALLPAGVQRVAVMLRPGQDEWDDVYAGFKPDCVQADADSLARLALPAGVHALPVYRDHESFDPGEVASGARCLFEGSVSGSGRKANWERAAALARRAEVVLAGGLDPGNVPAAVRQVRPWGVDVSSGVESERGVKDCAKVRAFVRAAREAEARR